MIADDTVQRDFAATSVAVDFLVWHVFASVNSVMFTSLNEYFLDNYFEQLNIAWQSECCMTVCFTQGSDTLESFLSKVAVESNLRKKVARIEHVLIVKVYFKRRKTAKVFMTHEQVFFRKSVSKATFERKLSSVSLPSVLEHGNF